MNTILVFSTCNPVPPGGFRKVSERTENNKRKFCTRAIELFLQFRRNQSRSLDLKGEVASAAACKLTAENFPHNANSTWERIASSQQAVGLSMGKGAILGRSIVSTVL